jgi:putative salt-induced outer membrane protein
MKLISIFSVLCLISPPTFAEPVKGEFDLGFLNTQGNSDTQTINLKLALSKESVNWHHKASTSYFSDESNQIKISEKYELGAQSDHKLNKDEFLFILGNYEKDRFSGFDYQASLGTGYGYKFINTDDHILTFELGPGYRVNAIEKGNDEEEYTIRVAEFFDWKLSKNANFNQYLAIESGDENTITKFGIVITSTLTSTLSLKVGVNVKHTDKVPANTDDVDSETFASISYSF